MKRILKKRRKTEIPEYLILIVDIPARESARNIFGTFRFDQSGPVILNQTELLKEFGVIYVYDKINKAGMDGFNSLEF